MPDYTSDILGLHKEVYTTEKQKLQKKYFEDTARYYIGTLSSAKPHVVAARNYYTGHRDEADFQYLEDIYGMQNPIDLGFTNIIKPRVDALVGLSLLTEPAFSVQYTDKETIKAIKAEKAEKIKKEIVADLQRSLNVQKNDAQKGREQQQQEPGISERTIQFLEKLYKKYEEEYLSSYEIASQHLLNLITTDSENDLSTIKKEAAKDYFITGEAYVREVYKGEGKDPKIEGIIPEQIFTNRPYYDRDLKRASIVVTRRRVHPHQVMKELGDKITKEEAERLFSTYSTLDNYNIFDSMYNKDANMAIPGSDAECDTELEGGMHEMDKLYAKTGWTNNTYGSLNRQMVDLYHVEWLASSKIPDGKGGYVYREDRYECYRVGYDIYIGGRRCDEAPRTKDEPWKTTLSYKGAINASRNGKIQSLVNNMRELQDLYDIIMFFRNNAVAHSGVSGSRVNTAAIPKVLGKKFMERLTKWITIRKQGLELIDPTEEGAQLFQHYGEFSAAIAGDTINAINAILESLLMQADIISGVPRQMLGIIEERDAVENVRVGLNQVSILSLEMFRDLDKLLARAVQGTLDNYKYAYRKKPKAGVYKNGVALIPYVLSPEKYSTVDHKIHVVSAGIEGAKLMKIQQLAKELAGGGLVDPDVIIKIINNKSVHEIEAILTKAVAKKKEETANIMQLQGQLEEAGKTIKQLEAEIQRLNNNNQENAKAKLELDRDKFKRDTEFKQKELELKKKKEEKEAENKKKELQLKAATVELEKEQILYGSGNSKEVKNNLI